MKKRRRLKKPRISGNKPKLGRIPTAPPSKWFRDRTKYVRKPKHKGDIDE